jgi:hypothetical protein
VLLKLSVLIFFSIFTSVEKVLVSTITADITHLQPMSKICLSELRGVASQKTDKLTVAIKSFFSN